MLISFYLNGRGWGFLSMVYSFFRIFGLRSGFGVIGFGLRVFVE